MSNVSSKAHASNVADHIKPTLRSWKALQDLNSKPDLHVINHLDYPRKGLLINVRNAIYRRGYHDFIHVQHRRYQHGRLPQTDENHGRVSLIATLLMVLGSLFSHLAWRRKHNH